MKRKKVVLVIVEGPSDDTALRMVLEKMFNPERVFVQVVHGDITSDKASKPHNILRKVNEQITLSTTTRNRFKRSDILLVIHLIDTDGTYVSEETINQIPTVKEYVYSPTQIIAPDAEEVIERNKRKKANMDILARREFISQVPYLAVYMSCNLDHVLYNKVNSSDEEKKDDSRAFARRYRNDPVGFKQFISESDFSVMGTRKETWEYIREGLHSLERHTNLGICFDTADSLRDSDSGA